MHSELHFELFHRSSGIIFSPICGPKGCFHTWTLFVFHINLHILVRISTPGCCKAGQNVCLRGVRFTSAPSHALHFGTMSWQQRRKQQQKSCRTTERSQEVRCPISRLGRRSLCFFPRCWRRTNTQASEVYIILSESMKERSHEHSDCARLFCTSRLGGGCFLRSCESKQTEPKGKHIVVFLNIGVDQSRFDPPAKL